MEAHNMPPQWIANAGLVWSSVPEHHGRYVEAKADCETLPGVIKKKEKAVKDHADDLVALVEAIEKKPKDSVLKVRHEDKRKAHDRLSGEIVQHGQRITQAQRTTDHFDHKSIEQAWATLFGEELPTTSPDESWSDSDGQEYHLYPKHRIVTRGKYDGILIPADEQPAV
jgi:hypothetical protein